MMRAALAATIEALQDWLSAVATLPTEYLLAALLGLVLLVLAARLLRRRAKRPKPPDLLLSRGEIAQAENSGLQHLTVKVSNLNPFPVQLLELAVKTDRMPAPLGIDAVELLPPHQAVELEAALPHDVVGDTGVVHAYAHVPGRSAAVYRLQATFEWEPWNKRYKISPLGQTLRRARRLSSSEQDAYRKRAWLERNPHLRSGPAPAEREEPEDPKPKAPAWEFPQDF